jgi:hypothetical protein
MDLREKGLWDGRWMQLAQDRVQWRALVLAVLNLRALLPESYSTLCSEGEKRETDVKKGSRGGNGKWKLRKRTMGKEN